LTAGVAHRREHSGGSRPVTRHSQSAPPSTTGLCYLGRTVTNLSDKAQAAQEALRDASAKYQAIVDRVIDNPRGPFVEELREAEERVAEAAARWALDYEEGAEPS